MEWTSNESHGQVGFGIELLDTSKTLNPPTSTTAQSKRKSTWVYVWRKWEYLGFVQRLWEWAIKVALITRQTGFVFVFCFLFNVSEVKILFGLKMKPRPLCSVFKTEITRTHNATQRNTSTHTNNKDTNLCLSVPSLSSSSIFKFTNFDCMPGA